MKRLSALILFFCLTIPAAASGQTAAPRQYESVKFRQTAVRHRATVSLSRSEDRPDIFVLKVKGQGDFYSFRDVTWTSEAELKREDSLWTTLGSRTTIRKKQGQMIVEYKKVYDYTAKKIRCLTIAPDGTITSEIKFPIKGKTCDDVTMFLFLEDFVHGKNIPPFRHFYLLTNEPHYYRTRVQLMGEENLALASGTARAFKLKLTAELGILDDILDRFARHTYVWYAARPPHVLLRYQGYEKGRGSAYIQTSLTSAP